MNKDLMKNESSSSEVILGSVMININLPRQDKHHTLTFRIGRDDSHSPRYFIDNSLKERQWPFEEASWPSEAQEYHDDFAIREGMPIIGEAISDIFGEEEAEV